MGRANTGYIYDTGAGDIWAWFCLGKIREHGAFQVENVLFRFEDIESALSLDCQRKSSTRLKALGPRTYLPRIYSLMLNKLPSSFQSILSYKPILRILLNDFTFFQLLKFIY